MTDMTSEVRRAEKRLIRIQEVSRRTGFGRAMLYRLMKEGEFPASVKLGRKSVAWDNDQITLWIEERIAGARGNK